MNRWQSGRVEISDGYLAYHRTGGRKPVLVLAHGLTDNGLCWSRVALELESGFDVVMLDARGHGESSRPMPGKAFSPSTDIAEAIDQLALEAPVLMGHSVGACAIASFANTHPHRGSQVILEDPPFLPPRTAGSPSEKRLAAFRKQVAGFASMTDSEIVAMGRSSSPGWHDDEFPAWAQSKKQVDANVISNLQSDPWRDTINLIAEPTLLVYGDADKGGIVTREIAEEAASINPNISLAHIEGAGHNVRRENFESYMVAVRTFLNV